MISILTETIIGNYNIKSTNESSKKKKKKKTGYYQGLWFDLT